jgi:type I restriction enzyme R subunit
VTGGMTDNGENGQLSAEQRARVLIDRQLRGAGWAVQDRSRANLTLPGVAVREVIMASGHGRADYVLYVDKRADELIARERPTSTSRG